MVPHLSQVMPPGLLLITSQFIGQFQLYWTKQRKSQRQNPTDSIESCSLHRGETEARILTVLPQSLLSLLAEMCSQMVACMLPSNYSAGEDCTRMQR